MRVATSSAYDNAVDTLQKRQRELAELQMKLTSGKRVERASDDPAAAARVERALATVGNLDADQRALSAGQNAMTLAESALGNAGELLQQTREALVAAGNASYSAGERKALVQQLQQLRGQLLAVANSTDGSGTYLFGGLSPDQPPFDAAGNPTAVDGTLRSGSADGMPLTVNGRRAFSQVMSGNGVFETARAATNTGDAWIDAGRVDDPRLYDGQTTWSMTFTVAADGTTTYDITGSDGSVPVSGAAYQTGQPVVLAGAGLRFTVSGQPKDGDRFDVQPSTPDLSVFAVFDNAIAQLSDTSQTAGQRAQTVQTSLRDLDAAAGSLMALRSEVGQVLNRADLATDRNGQMKVFAQGEQSQAQDLDMVEAISEFTNKQTGYDAALKAYAAVQKLSLFQYI
ncbi:flagellar hook-associated protein FlgL [Aquabacterium sp. J223]|uniref:flagellar hook-associated protein FlgL n=1 Tax=Aquabacterium sp. J223 TaxID=2898431 RepID=UPI0021AD97A8|nr:flagellar hook-associated protein FlgL [Aquabacterium sp. J223]UUX97562.1 flagellar hook-associated protein FlgL [Aquabacterium sp. J223]